MNFNWLSRVGAILLLVFCLHSCVTISGTGNLVGVMCEATDGTNAGDNTGGAEGGGLGEAAQAAAMAVGHPEVAGAIEILKSFKRDTSSSTTQIIERSTFDFIRNVFDNGNGDVWVDKLDQLVEFWLNDEHFSNMPEAHKKVLSKSMAEYRLTTMGGRYFKNRYELSFNNGRG